MSHGRPVRPSTAFGESPRPSAPGSGRTLGIDIGGTKTAVVVLGPDGEVQSYRAGPSGSGARDVVARAVALVRDAVNDVGGVADIHFAGACIPGLVDPVSGTVRHAVNVGVDSLDLGEALSTELGVKVRIENDVKAAASGVEHVGAHGGALRFAYLNVGTGMAAALIDRGVLVRGVEGAAGEIGHIPVGGTQECPCGQVGCLETICSGSALVRMWPDAATHGWDAFEAARGGDRSARIALDMQIAGLALAVQILVVASGAHHVVVGGGLTALGQPLLEAVQGELRARAQRSPFLESLRLDQRISFVATDVPLAAIGAAVIAHASPLPESGGPSWKS